MLDMPSAFSCQAMHGTSSPGCTQAVAGQEVEGASKGREEGTGRRVETPPFTSSRTTEITPGSEFVSGAAQERCELERAYVVFQSHWISGLVGVRWVCWVGVCNRFTKETQGNKFCGSIPNRKYF